MTAKWNHEVAWICQTKNVIPLNCVILLGTKENNPGSEPRTLARQVAAISQSN